MNDLPRFRSGGVLPSLTGLRCIAAATVLLFHVHTLRLLHGPDGVLLDAALGAGSSAVSLFFVLSGFVLAWGHRPGASARRFWVRRAARLFPLHLVVLAAAVVLSATVLPQIRTADGTALLANAMLVSGWRADWWQAGNPVSWSIVCEGFFYLLFPLLAAILDQVGRRLLTATALGAALLVVVLPSLAASVPFGVDAYSSPIMRLPEFIVGVALGRLMASGWQGPRLLPALIATAAGYAVASIGPASMRFSAATILGFGLLVPALARVDLQRHACPLANRALVRLGEYSFAFYLVHLLVLQTVFTVARPLAPAGDAWSIAMIAVSAAAGLGVAAGLHHIVEQPMLSMVTGWWPPRSRGSALFRGRA